MSQLNITDHSRDAAGMTYVYPVVSRRSNGVSVGVNLNPNNACNWRCIYCQVPDLKRGGPPPIDLALLERELRAMLQDILHGDYLQRHVPEDMRRLNDVALSGNGEPTTAREFAHAVDTIRRVLDAFGLLGRIKVVLITNGSQMAKPDVQEGLKGLAALQGEVWFKFDRATQAGMRLVNDTELSPERAYANLRSCAALCPTWLQTCLFALDGAAPTEAEMSAYFALLARAKRDGIPLKGVFLYGLARPSLQPEAPRLSRLPGALMHSYADSIAALDIPVHVYP